MSTQSRPPRGSGHPARGEASLARSVALLRAFRHEQDDPSMFYRALAADSARQVTAFTSLDGALLLDVGGGPGYFAAAFEEHGARYLAVDADAGELSAAGQVPERTVVGSGAALPVADATVDVCYSSNVLEHVEQPWRMADEMVRVTRPGGLVFLAYTLWWGPWGGHETAPWHYLGGHRAADRYRRRHGRAPKNVYGTSLFRVTAAEGLRWAERAAGADLLAAFPRYLPGWAHPVVRVPGVREVVTWNLALVLRRR